METLVEAAHHRDQYCSRSNSRITDHFGSSPWRGFKEINTGRFSLVRQLFRCRLPRKISLLMAILDPNLLPITRSHPKEVGANPSPLTPQQTPKGASFADDLCFSELWSGPAYSDSPPPSSLPIPKYYLRQKRSVSLELPVRRSEVTMPPIIKISALFSHQRVHFFHQQLPSY